MGHKTNAGSETDKNKGTTTIQHQQIATTWDCIYRVTQSSDLSTKARNKDSYVKSCLDADDKFNILKHIVVSNKIMSITTLWPVVWLDLYNGMREN